jgi:type I restriction-modification system DNA methylase subunit
VVGIVTGNSVFDKDIREYRQNPQSAHFRQVVQYGRCSLRGVSSAQFAAAEGKKGGQFYTARCVVKLLVEMIEPYKGRVYDPCCGSSGMFVQSAQVVGGGVVA